MRRFLRYLRTAFSATCLIACVLLIALWVRSYSWHDMVAIGITLEGGFLVTSEQGAAELWYITAPSFVEWKVTNIPSPSQNLLPIGTEESYAGFLFEKYTDGFRLSVPYWFLVPVVTALAAVPWLRWWSNRFSLRTLLIATTLVAVVLGLIIAVLRWSAD
jgi:hypothetical protein